MTITAANSIQLQANTANEAPGPSPRRSSDQPPKQPPWEDPRTVTEAGNKASYRCLKERLATIPTQSRQSRQSLYIDLWTGQHWLGLNISGPHEDDGNTELLKPVSTDTALSVATISTYRNLNQPLFTPTTHSGLT